LKSYLPRIERNREQLTFCLMNCERGLTKDSYGMTTDTLSSITARVDEFARMPGGIEQLRHALMTAAFTGELVPQHDHTESVDALLERLAFERRSLNAI
jgi:hypothetical protein